MARARTDRSEPSEPSEPSDEHRLPETLAEVPLTDAALGVSAVSGKAFRSGDRCFGHVQDPRTGEPVQRALLAAVALPGATEADALSTALLVMGPAGLARLAEHQADLRAWLVLLEPGSSRRQRVLVHGSPATSRVPRTNVKCTA